MKKFLRFLPGSAPFVIGHAIWKRSRGKKPSMSFNGERGPAKALRLAREMFGEGSPYDPIVNPSQPVNYSMITAPASYRCCLCGARGVKLWREYQTFLDHQSLLCAPCAARIGNKDISDIDSEGCRSSLGGRTNQIGWYIPAVPTEQNDTFWGYSSVPQEGWGVVAQTTLRP